jgi:hypothetical protein
MPRKSIQELIAQATADFPDNVAGLITPAKLRQWAIDFLNAISPAYGYLTLTGPLTQTFGLTPALVVMQAAFNSDPSQTTAAVPASTVTKVERGNVTINFTMDFETSNGRFVTFTLYRNGVATPWRVTGNGGGNGNPIAVSLTAVDYTPDPNTVYDIRGSAEVAGTSVIMSNGGMILSVEPVRSFT